MEKELRKTPKAKRGKRPQTPESKRVNLNTTRIGSMNVTSQSTSSRSRATMAPGDFVLPSQPIIKRKLNLNRQSIAPAVVKSVPILDASKRIEEDDKDEVDSLYNEHLQILATQLIAKKKSKEQINEIYCILNTRSQSLKKLQDKYMQMFQREEDIRNLTIVQSKFENLALHVNTFYETFCTDKKVKDFLVELKSLLEPLDKLRCQNIFLPETESVAEFSDIFDDSQKILSSIKEVIGTKNDNYEKVSKLSQEFSRIYKDMNSLQNKVEETFNNVAIVALKKSSTSMPEI